MEEPSVLDYLKSKLRFWQKGNKLTLGEELPEIETLPSAEPAKKRLPWRSTLALILALAGQRAFEPPNRALILGVCLYLISAGLFAWAVLRNEWITPRIPDQETRSDPMTVQLVALLPSAIFALTAFFLFGGNLFTGLNLILWLLAIACLFWAFWLPSDGSNSLFQRFKYFIRRDGWQFKISRWHFLVLVVMVLVLFFRAYHLNSVPAEPFSDHAEKIQDVYDITQGQTHIFFPRNTGREGLQMYWTVLVASIFQTGLSFISLKIGTVLLGFLTLPYLYLLGKEIANRRVGLVAVLFAGIAYWPNVINRVGLRFPLYPLFVAPVLFYLIRGLQRSTRNDFILAGFFLGLGLHGYSPYRIMPFLVTLAIGLFILHRQSAGNRKQAVIWFVLLAITSLFVFLPLLRYWMQNPQIYAYRAFSRLGGAEQPLVSAWWQVLLSNSWNAMRMFNWSDGEIWVHSVPFRPALDMVSAALFLIGSLLLFIRYLRERHWLDLFLILSIPVLMLPSILSLAFPAENPALNRTAGAIVPVFIIIAWTLDGFWQTIRNGMSRRYGTLMNWSMTGLLLVVALAQNYDLVFNQYDQQFRLSAWNSSEMGTVMEQFGTVYGSTDNAWIIPFPYWVDTRLPGIWAGIPDRDFALWSENLSSAQLIPGAKLFLFNVEDTQSGNTLKSLFPQGSGHRFLSKTPNHDFMVYFVP
jgi:hypothetical protein